MTTENRLPAVPSTASEHSPDATDGPNSSHHGRQDAYHREIVYSREDQDYKMVLDGECVGYARTYTEAERTLDALVLELISGGATYARPAEPAPEAVEHRIITERDIIEARQRIAENERKGEQQDFTDALLASPDLTPEMVRHWLDATPHVNWCACNHDQHDLIVCDTCGLPPYWKSKACPECGDYPCSCNQVHARPAEAVEPVYVAPTDGLLLTCASCGATKPLTAFVNVDQEVVCDACLAADARAGDGPTCIHCGDPCQDRTCPACRDAGEDAALDAAAHAATTAALFATDQRTVGEMLSWEFRNDPVGFLAQLETFTDQARHAVAAAMAVYVDAPVSEVIGLWGESRARAVALGMLS